MEKVARVSNIACPEGLIRHSTVYFVEHFCPACVGLDRLVSSVVPPHDLSWRAPSTWGSCLSNQDKSQFRGGGHECRTLIGLCTKHLNLPRSSAPAETQTQGVAA